MALMVFYIGEYALTPWTDFDYIWHGTSQNHPKTTIKISSTYLYFLMSYGYHRQTHKHLISLYRWLTWAQVLECHVLWWSGASPG
jgi:hypothetical protein